MRGLLLGLALTLLSLCVNASERPLRVLAIGNSYTRSLEPELPKVAKAAGVNLELAIFAIGAFVAAVMGALALGAAPNYLAVFIGGLIVCAVY